jgi:hypothetical protein
MDRKNSINQRSAANYDYPMNRKTSWDQSPPGESPKLTQDLRKSYGTNWTKGNVSVLFEWISIASYNIRCLEMATAYYRKKLRMNTILGLVLATLSGTIATTQATFSSSVPNNITITLNVFFIIMSFTIAITTGYIKVYHIQENLEENIKIKQNWIVFSTEIASELQLPTELRRDALWMIIKNKNIYLELLKMNMEIPACIAAQARKDFREETKLNMEVSSLPRILIDISLQEMRDLDIENKDDRLTSVATKQLKHYSSLAQKFLPSEILEADEAASKEEAKSKESALQKKVSFTFHKPQTTSQNQNMPNLKIYRANELEIPSKPPAKIMNPIVPSKNGVKDSQQMVTLDMNMPIVEGSPVITEGSSDGSI